MATWADLQIERKVWHLTMVGLMFAIYRSQSLLVSLSCLTAGSVLFIGGDFVRLRDPALNTSAVRAFRWVIRDHERNGPAGTTYLLLGVWIAVLAYSRQVVELTLLFLAVGDPIASFFGVLMGKDPLIGKKTLQGSIAAFVVCTLGAVFYFQWEGLFLDRLLLVAALAGITGALAELVPIGKLDDNLTFPVLSGAGLTALFLLFSSP